jgi:hypothetical protein
MAEYLIEQYVSRETPAIVEAGAKRARHAAAELKSEGHQVRHVRSIFVPEDETCFHLFEAETADAVREAARRAGLPIDRVTEAVTPSVARPPAQA